MKIRAEDGRSILHTDISLFINHLPAGQDTVDFSSENASGSTSQAANLIEKNRLQPYFATYVEFIKRWEFLLSLL